MENFTFCAVIQVNIKLLTADSVWLHSSIPRDLSLTGLEKASENIKCK